MSVAEAVLEPPDERVEPRLRLRDGEVAVRLARARDRHGADGVDVEREADLGEPGERLVDPRVGHVRDDEVLLAGDADVAAEVLGQLGDVDHLVAGDEADVDGDADVRETGPPLRVDADVVGERAGRRELEPEERAPEPALDLGAHPVRSVVVDHELHPRFHAGDAVAQVLLPRVEQRAEHLDRLVLRDEDAEVPGDPRHRREPAADQHAEAVDSVVDGADERDAVDLGRVAAVGAGGDRDLVLARQVRVLGVAVEEGRRLVDHRLRVEQLVVRDVRRRGSR